MAEERPPRPEPLYVIFDQIPGELPYSNNWILWHYEWKEGKDGKPGKWDKPPYQPNGKHASSTAAFTWSPFNTVKAAYERGLNLPVDDPLHFDGVGFVPAKVNQADNNLQFGDLDKCRDKETGQLSPHAEEDLALINSYCEISPSGTGIRFIAKGHPSYPQGQDGSKKGHVELYQGRHYLTITGHRLERFPATIEKRPEELNVFYQKHFCEPEPSPEAAPGTATGTKLTDNQIICLVSEAKNSAKFMALMAGNFQDYPSQSEADQAFCNLVGFYTTNEEQIDRIFRRSKLYREKWERADYRERTIRKATSGAKEHYSGDGPKAETLTTEERYNELLETIKAKPQILAGNRDILVQLAILKNNDPIGFDLFIDKIKKAKIGIKVDTITDLVNANVEKLKKTTRCQKKDIDHDQAAISAAHELLEHGDPLRAHLDHVKERVCGGEKPARLVILSSYSAYLSNNDRIYADIVGSPQSGKSTITAAVLEGFPEENVINASEASPKSLYYLAQQQPERLKDAIIYIDDGRQEHIPVLKTFRNEGNVRPTNLTVVDGEFLELVVQYRPVVLASSVTPLRDLEGQATSRAFLASVPDATPEEELKVRAKIRQQIETNALLSQKNDSRQKTLQEMARILRDEGIRDVVIPFDVKEPQGADRRGTGQFMRLIKVSAFINQFLRPIIELQDGRKFVLAIYADFETAAKVWFDFAEGQEYKISAKVLEVLKFLPETWPGKSAPTVAKEMGKSQRTTERYLEDLYESGIASREKITAPGMPYGYWVEPATTSRVLAQIPEDVGTKTNSVIITTEEKCREYMAKNSSDSLKDSYINFFSNNDIDIKKMYKGGKVSLKKESVDGLSSWVYSYTPLFSPNSCRDSENKSKHSETITTNGLSQILTQLPDSDLEMSQSNDEIVAIPTMSKIDRPTPDPGRERFKAGMAKRHCLVCGRNFSYDLGIHYLDGYICQACQSGQGPEEIAKPNPQKKLTDRENSD